MPRTDLTWRTRRLAEGYYSSEVYAPQRRPIRTFLPLGYEPNYPYPLIVFLHGHGSNEDQALKLAPKVSRRNYVAISLRGSVFAGLNDQGRKLYTWDVDTHADTTVDDYIVSAVEQTRRMYHVHSERIYLAGVCEGATLAYRFAMNYPDRIAGVIALNGSMQAPKEGGPLLRLPDVRRLRVFIGHGIANSVVPLGRANRDYRVLYAAGCDVAYSTYPTTHRLHAHMMRDVNRWIMEGLKFEE